MTEDVKISDTPQLTEQYYKVRKSLALFSGLLFAWEFIGLEITPKPIQNLDIHIKSPQATPYVLLILVVYFTVRIMIEWYQSSLERRTTRTSKVDLGVTLAIPAISVITFTLQRLLDIQIADKISGLGQTSTFALMSGFTIGLPITYIFFLRRSILGLEHPAPPRIIATMTIMVVLGLIMMASVAFLGRPLETIVLSAISAGITIIVGLFIVGIKKGLQYLKAKKTLSGQET